MEPPAGAEFFLQRLQRAQAIPPAERGPDVAAFVESVVLLCRIGQLLPLDAAGAPALPDSSATRRRLLRAMLLKASADYLCPESSPVSDRNEEAALAAYAFRGRPEEEPVTNDMLLFLGLRLYCQVSRSQPSYKVAPAAINAMVLLSDPACRAANIRLLLQLGSKEEEEEDGEAGYKEDVAAGGRGERLALPTLPQLLHASACQIVNMAWALLTSRSGAMAALLPASQQGELRDASAQLRPACCAGSRATRRATALPPGQGSATASTDPQRCPQALAEMHVAIARLAGSRAARCGKSSRHCKQAPMQWGGTSAPKRSRWQLRNTRPPRQSCAAAGGCCR
ncbi:hypothetical protein ABPG75_009443 [Micractinium tetrahymenae]